MPKTTIPQKFDLIPYFQYKIGPYQSDYYLYFAKQPYLQVYKNEIFNKMYEYEGYLASSNLTMPISITKVHTLDLQ